MRIVAWVRRRWLQLSCAGIGVLAVNAWVQSGAWPMVVIALAAVGATVLIAGLGWTSGAVVVKHSLKTRAAIEGGHPEQVRAAIDAGLNPRAVRR